MSVKEVSLVAEHLSQLKEMLESAELEYEQYEEDDFIVVELFNGTRFIFDEDGFLKNIDY